MAADGHDTRAGRRVRLALLFGTVAMLTLAPARGGNAADDPPLDGQVAACGGCHGEKGARAGDGAQMAEVVYALSDDDLSALAHRIAHFR